MTSTFSPWQEAGPGISFRSYRASKFGPANCVAFRIGEGRSAVLSPLPAPDAGDIAQAERYGEVAALIAPSYGHLAGIDDWQSRYPNAALYAPQAACDLAARTGKGRFSPLGVLETDACVHLEEVPGARTGGTLLSVKRDGPSVVYLDEVVISLPHPPGTWLYRQLFRWKGVRPGIGVNRIYTDLMAKDRRRLASAAQRLLADASLCLVAHGPPITTESDIAKVKALLAALK